MYRFLVLILIALSWQVAALAASPADRERSVLHSRYVDPHAGVVGKIRVAILPFSTPDSVPELRPYGEGVMDSLISGLQNVPQFMVIDRGRIDRVIKEQALALTGLLDPGAAVKTGRLLGAQTLMTGTIQAVGDQIRIAASFTDVQTGQIRDSQQVTGLLTDIFDLQEQLAMRFIRAQKAAVTPEQQRRLQKVLKATSSLTAYQYYLRGRQAQLLLAKSGFAEAVPWYERAIAVDPQYALAYAGLGETWAYWGFQKLQNGEAYREEYERAYAAARKALALNPDLAEAHRAFGRACGNLGLQGREAEARRALDLNANDGESWYELWIATGAMNPDHEYIRRALSLNPDLIAAHVERGLALASQQRYEEATTEYREAIRINPGFFHPYNNLGSALFNLKQYDTAMAAYREALRIDPRNAGAYSNLAEVLFALKRYEEAIGVLQKALKINPQHAIAHYNMGDILLAQGKKKEAIQQYELYLQYAPNAQDEMQVRERIRSLSWSL